VNKNFSGFAPIISFAGTRLSEHQSKQWGFSLANLWKYSLSVVDSIKLVVIKSELILSLFSNYFDYFLFYFFLLSGL
jgi:hypothetical protein